MDKGKNNFSECFVASDLKVGTCRYRQLIKVNELILVFKVKVVLVKGNFSKTKSQNQWSSG